LTVRTCLPQTSLPAAGRSLPLHQVLHSAKLKDVAEALCVEANSYDFTKSENWRCFLDEVRTFFDENPETNFDSAGQTIFLGERNCPASAFFLPAGGVWEEMRAGFGFAKKIFESPILICINIVQHLPIM